MIRWKISRFNTGYDYRKWAEYLLDVCLVTKEEGDNKIFLSKYLYDLENENEKVLQ